MTDIINEEENTTPLPEEEQETTVVDNGQTYVSEESTIIAQQAAQEAKLWAEESEAQANIATRASDDAAQAKDDAVAAKEYAEAAVTDANVVAVGTDLRATPSNIKTVANNISDVTTVAGISSNVTTVAGNTTNINTVAGVSSNVTTVATNILNVNNVSSISSAVVAVSEISSDVTATAGNATDIIAVAANNTNISAVAANETNINAVNANKTNIDKVAGNETNITAVANNATNINAVNANKTNIDAVAANNTNISAVAADLTNIDAVAADLTNIDNASANAQLARDWAVKMDGIVASEDYSAKYYANQSQTSAELSAQYANDKINQTHITNCITEIPQNIKLELNNGTLTLKAGSKVYIPNGTNRFDEVVISSNLTITSTATASLLIFYNLTENILWWVPTSGSRSGSSNPSDLWGFFYNTSDNKVYYLRNTSSPDNLTFSLPIALINSTASGITSIDQVFNGFGYIGSTIFALPCVKGLIPNGRNIDGTLNSIEKETEKVITKTYGSASVSHTYTFFVSEDDFWTRRDDDISYNENVNYYKDASGNFTSGFAISNFTADSSGKITTFTPKTVFHAADNNSVVHLTGDETIADIKTFTSSINVQQSDSWFDMLKMDSSNRPYIAGRSNTSITSSALCTIRNGYYYNIELNNNGDGTGYTVCPASDINGSIVTTVNKSKSKNGYFQLGNGMIIQWGWYKVNNSAKTTITFPTPFSGDSTYAVSTDIYSPDDNRNNPFTIKAKTASAITIYNGFNGGTNYCFIIAIGY